jgi:hypothetical protein
MATAEPGSDIPAEVPAVEVLLIPEQSYTVRFREQRLEGMRVVGTWNGFIELRGEHGTLIVRPGQGPILRAHAELFAGVIGERDYPPAVVLKSSPAILEKLGIIK